MLKFHLRDFSIKPATVGLDKDTGEQGKNLLRVGYYYFYKTLMP